MDEWVDVLVDLPCRATKGSCKSQVVQIRLKNGVVAEGYYHDNVSRWFLLDTKRRAAPIPRNNPVVAWQSLEEDDE